MSAQEPTDFPDEPDRAPGCIAPRENHDLFGHEEAERAFDAAYTSGHLHHAWLLAGPRGIGKASLAYRMARRVLGAKASPAHGILGADPDDPVSQRIAAMSHGDLMVLRRPFDDKRKRWRAEITVDEARRMAGLFQTRAAEGGARVCIVDTADALNLNAANAILKTLEEPPDRALIILVAHAPGRLPATIRSRCRRLDLRRLSDAMTQDIAVKHGASADEAALVGTLAAGSPGRAIAIAAMGGAALWREIDQLISNGAALGQERAHVLARRLALAKAEAERKLFFELLAMRLERDIRAAAQAGGAQTLEPWFALRSELAALGADMERLYLDPAQVVFCAIQSTWRTLANCPLNLAGKLH